MVFSLRRIIACALFLASTASAQITCSTTLGSIGTPSPARGRAQSDFVADFFLTCEGTPPANGISGVVTVSLNTPITSVITNLANNASEALLLIGEPSPQDQLGQPVGGPAIPGANVIQGVQTGSNSIRFSGVPLMPQNTSGFQSRIFRIVNLRANSSQLSTGASIVSTVSITAAVAVDVRSPSQIVGTVGPPLNFSVRTPNDSGLYSMQINSCQGNNSLTPQVQPDFLVKFIESDANEFRKRNTATTLNNPNNITDQNSLSSIFGFGTESGFVNRSLPLVSNMYQAGVATHGTRLAARFTNIPAGAQLWITTRPAVPGTSGTGITAVLVNTNLAGDGDFNPIVPTLGPYVRLDTASGSAQAIWEVFDTNPQSLETIAFGVVLSIPAASASSGALSVGAFHAPAAATLSPATITRPFFAPETAAGVLAADVRGCVSQLTISTGCPLNAGSVGVAFTQSLLSAGGTLPHTWSVISGSPPPGIALAPNGLLSGTPTQGGVFNFTLRLTDASGTSLTRECSLEIRGAVSIVTSCPLPDAAQSQPYSATLAASGGVPPYTWLIARGALPGGLALTPSGLIAGAPSLPGLSSFTLRATDSRAVAAERDCAIRVLAPFSLTPSAMLFRAPAGSGPIAPQVIHMVAEPSGQSWDIRVSSFSGGDWLKASPSNGRVPAVIEVTPDTTGLAEGSYEGSIAVFTRGATQQSFGVGIRLEVGPALPPKLSAEPAGVLIAVPAATSRADRIVTIANRGSGSIPIAATLNVATGQGWIQAPAVTGTLGPGGSMRLPLQISPGALEPGLYQATVRVRNQSPNSEEALSIPVTLAVSSSRDSMRVEPASINLESAIGSGSPAPVRVSIAAPGEGTVNWQGRIANATPSSGWLSISSTTGRATPGAPSAIDVRANTEGLAPGRYMAEIAIDAPGIPDSPKSVLVALNLRGLGNAPQPSIEPSALIVDARSDGGIPRGAITIRNPSGRPFDVDFRLAADSSLWTIATPSGRTVPAGGQIQIDVAADPARLPTAVSRSTLLIQTTGDPLVRPVDLVWVPASPSGRAIAPDPPRQIDAVCPPGGITLASSVVPYGFRAAAGSAFPLTILAFERNGTRFQNGAISASISGSAAALQPVSPGVWIGSVPVPSVEGPVVLSILAEDFSRGVSGCLELPGTVDPSSSPFIPPGAILSTASFAPFRPLAPGGILALFGSRLATGRTSGTLPLPNELNGTSVRIGGSPVPLFFAADLGEFTQVNGVLPYRLAPNVGHQVIVNSPAGAAASEVVITAAQPGIFAANQAGTGQAIAVHGSNPLLLANAETPIGPGEVLVIYAEGLGSVDPASTAGQPAPAEPLSRTTLPVSVSIGGINAPVAFSGLTPGFTGLYQINVTVPQGVPAGNAIPVIVTAGGQPSPVVTIAVRP